MVKERKPLWVRISHWLITNSSWFFGFQQRVFARGYRDLCAVFRPMLPEAGGRVLDVGCGTAHCAMALLGKNKYRYTGMDSNPHYINGNRQRWPEGEFILADRLDEQIFADNSYDCVLVSSLLHHIDDTSADDLICQLQRVLVPGGTILVTDPLFWDFPKLSIRQKVSNKLLQHDRGQYIRSKEGYKKLFGGMSLIEEREYIYTIHRFWAAQYRTDESVEAV